MIDFEIIFNEVHQKIDGLNIPLEYQYKPKPPLNLSQLPAYEKTLDLSLSLNEVGGGNFAQPLH